MQLENCRKTISGRKCSHARKISSSQNMELLMITYDMIDDDDYEVVRLRLDFSQYFETIFSFFLFISFTMTVVGRMKKNSDSMDLC